MLVILKANSTESDVGRVVCLAEERGHRAYTVPAGDRLCVFVANASRSDRTPFELLPGVERVVPVALPYRLAARESHPADTVVTVGKTRIGGNGFVVCAGPCAVEGEEQLLATARFLRDCGVDLLRGGAYKPRSSPYDFQGLGKKGLEALARARTETGLPVITEAVDEASLALVEEYADIVQIGARNMQNYALLQRAGKSRLPVFLKRGMSATLEDWLLSAEYVLSAGNSRVILCERGIRTFSTHSRFTLDLGVIPVARSLSHLPVFVDPSHATGHRDRVGPMAKAALAAGADGVMLEAHPAPAEALSDGTQALVPARLKALVAELRALAAVLDRKLETVP
jgi:3-deoxy-7-phosphoheptulonate synthase